MCGIVGYIGKNQAQPILFEALKRLEYRGYDSSGIAIKGTTLHIFKDQVRVEALERTTPKTSGTIGIGHTRWATHGEPSRKNAHPHPDCSGKFAAVHNGIISNYLELKTELEKEGHGFISETDTEVFSHLVEKYYTHNLEQAVEESLKRMEGAYAFAIICSQEEKMVVAKKGAPLIIGRCDEGNIIASDLPALLEYTNLVTYLEDGDLAVITADQVHIFCNSQEVSRPAIRIAWKAEDVSKNGYDHFMRKEIFEQPDVIRRSLAEFTMLGESVQEEFFGWAGKKGVLLIGCGTSYHAAMVGKIVIEELLGLPVNTELASELIYRRKIPSGYAVVAITQSGETADTLVAAKKLHDAGNFVLAITNVKGSSITRIANKVIYTSAGPEMSVAATKSFVAQLMALYRLVLFNPAIGQSQREKLVTELKLLPYQVQCVLDIESQIEDFGEYLSRYSNIFYIGRGINYPTALEGALKLKEISYIHSEAYAAGEIKHGPFSLLHQGTPVVAVINRDESYAPMISNIKEIRSRKSPVIAIIASDVHLTGIADGVIQVPNIHYLFSPTVFTVITQLLAYHAAKFRSCPIDFPRNLAKSVTVE